MEIEPCTYGGLRTFGPMFTYLDDVLSLINLSLVTVLITSITSITSQ
jgi:hypothetical protein